MARKSYKGNEVTVTFDLKLCTHSGRCVRGLPAVFDLEKRPWIQPDGADVEAVRAAVGRCPSGALAIADE